jgi:hypothetical protein
MNTISRQPAGLPVGGQFAATAHAEPGLTLISTGPVVSPTRPWRPYELADNGDGTFTFNNVAGAENVLKHRQPGTRSEIRRALSCPRSRGRVVDLNAAGGRRNSPSDDVYEVVGPDNGAPLVIRIHDGFHVLEITSGNVQVEVMGSFSGVPGRTTVCSGAEAGVIVDGDNEHVIENRGTGRARVALSTDARVRLRASGTGQTYVAGGGPECSITARNGAVVHQDGPEEGRLPVHRPAGPPHTLPA